MSKRFVDTTRFLDPWYRSLSPKNKVFWDFLTSNCDISGAWKKDFAFAGFAIEATAEAISEEQMLQTVNTGKIRVVVFGDYWYIVDFIQFQYGELNWNCRPHRAVIKCLEGHIRRGLPKKYFECAKAATGNGASENGKEERWQNPPRGFKSMVKKLSDKGV